MPPFSTLFLKGKSEPARIFSEKKYDKDRERLQSFKIAMLEMVPRTGRLSVLDLGCGTGEMSARLAALHHRVCGIDISWNAMKKYSLRGFSGMVGDLEYGIPIRSRKFDLLWCSEVIEHLHCPDLFLAECYRILKPGGQLFLSTPNSAFYAYRILRFWGIPWERLQHPGHRNFFTYSSLGELMRLQGFKISECFGYNVYLLIPSRVFSWISNKSLQESIIRLIKLLRFKPEEGLIHGDKWLWSHLSNRSNSLFSTNIIIRAIKPDNQEKLT